MGCGPLILKPVVNLKIRWHVICFILSAGGNIKIQNAKFPLNDAVLDEL